ncbi:S8 family serine peptidase [Streptomyces sp. NPDC051940]|uniref:S8 family serine peptidase n=1 Tax=Streptomyces sp. NPDC051940 TaxID=3155675 RepID=UPI0034248D36
MHSIPRRRSVLAATATALAISGGLVLLPASAQAGAAEAVPSVGEPEGPSYDITLVTGDVVHYRDLPGANDVVTVEPAPGTGAVHIQRYGDDTYVIPQAATSLLAADRLDERLFDVTGLVEMGYDDARSGGIPVIATASDARTGKSPATPKGAVKARELRSIKARAMKADDARAFWKDIAPGTAPKALDNGIGKLWLDGRVRGALSESVPQVGAPQAWAKGYDGSGVKVAVLDTGIDATHPDVQGRIVGTKSFVPGEEVADRHGHGTHVASTIAGSGAASGGAKKGVAPGVGLLVGKVLANSGSGADSGVIEGMEWAKEQGADVVSMSLGGSGGSDGKDPLSLAVDALSANGGPLYVIAAGNDGAAGSIDAPGAAASALTVAAVDKSDKRASFSSQGPLTGSYALKPDISAPGVTISAAASQAVPGWTGGMYRTMSGTSMATPHVAGAAAIVKQAHPDWDGQRIKDALMSSSRKLDAYRPYSMGTGRVDVANAVTTTVEATGSVPAAVWTWPYADQTPVERTITYRNTGAADVTLNLAKDTQDAAYTLSANTVTVPAGGTAQVRLTLDPAGKAPGTSFSGQVTATDAATGAVVAHTGFALHKEQELYDFTIKLRGRDGRPAAGTVALTYPGNPNPVLVNVGGERTLRLPPATYSVWDWLDVPGESADSQGMAMLTAPETVLAGGPATVVLDASTANRAYAVPQREAETTQTVVQLRTTYAQGRGGIYDAEVLPAKYEDVYVSPVAQVQGGTLRASLHWRLREKWLDAETGTGTGVELSAQRGSAQQDGRSLLKTVYAGRGTEADYAGIDARGKAVLVDRSAGVSPAQRARAATAAGAAMLVNVNDGVGPLYEDFSAAGGLRVASVKRLAGEQLVREAKSGEGTLNVLEKSIPDYRYDLLQTFDGSIPDRSLRYAPTHEELARVTNRFHRPGLQDALDIGNRYFVPTGGFAPGLDEYERFPGTSTDYVTPAPAGSGAWYEDHSVLTTDTQDMLLQERGPLRTYQAGQTCTQDWFKLVQAPRLGSGYWLPKRGRSNSIQWNFPLWSGSGEGHTASSGGAYGGSVTSALYQGDTLLRQVSDQAGGLFNALRPEELPYRFVVDATRDPALYANSVRTHTEFGFRSKYPAAGETYQSEIDLLNLTYDVDTDLDGRVPAGRVELGLGSGSHPNGLAATSAALQVSYDDGATWQPVTLTQLADGRWTATLTTPRTPGGFVSLRASAQGPNGLWTKQDVIRAFGLK